VAKAHTVYIATDGSQWDNENQAIVRDTLDAAVAAIEATLPPLPRDPHARVAVDVEAFKAAKTAVVELCRALYPREAVFQHDPMEIHPFSYAGRLLNEAGGPLDRVWRMFMCYRDGWLYEQPYYASNPEKWVPADGTM
jgi:hypothetical protein